MGKNKNSEFSVVDKRTGKTVAVDSLEEVEMYEWLDYALEKGIVRDFIYRPDTFRLSEPVDITNSKGKKRSLFREHVYSPDFKIVIDRSRIDLLDELKCDWSDFKEGVYNAWIDVKGTFNRNSRSFSIDQKWVWSKYGIYVHKVIPKKFFQKFGIRKEFLLTRKTGKPSAKYQGFPLVDDVFGV